MIPPPPLVLARVQFAALLGAEQLRELIDHGCSLRHIEASYGITRKTFRDELITHGMPIRSKNRHQSGQQRRATECPSIADRSTHTRLVNVHQ